ncbi:MAG TPA: heavy metal-associated domain-containing protein [Acidimicrobiia bacterium]|nr:heavy metal-associated domain-containing protein [Acidimicrobiia bacterium]
MHALNSNDAGRSASPDGWRTIRHFAYVDRSFRGVRRALAAAPQRLLADTAGPGDRPRPTAELRVRRIGFDIGRDVRMVLGDVEVGIHNARLPIRWEDATRPALFPILDAILEVAPVNAGRRAMTQLGLFGEYRPPFGRLGALADNVAGHGIVVESVERFLDELVERVSAMTVPSSGLDEDDPTDSGGGTPVAERRRIVFPVDGLDNTLGGAAGLMLRLTGVPGVVDASVNPISKLAVVEYDGAICRVADLLQVVEGTG